MGRNSRSGESKKASRSFVLRVPMHCECDGCVRKIGKAVHDLQSANGVEQVEATNKKGEVKVVAKADPEKLRKRLHKATGKSIDLLLPKPAAPDVDNRPARNEQSVAAIGNMRDVPNYHNAWENQGEWNYGLGTWAAPQVVAQPYPWAAPQVVSQPYPWAAPDSSSYPSGYPHGTYNAWPHQRY